MISEHLFGISCAQHVALGATTLWYFLRRVSAWFVFGFRGVCLFVFDLPSNERKTLGRGCGRLETPAERTQRARRESATADASGGPAGPSGLPMTAGTSRRRLLELMKERRLSPRSAIFHLWNELDQLVLFRLLYKNMPIRS